ncbi:MAG TPA: L-lactate dehydrogenase [Actinomycetota bacterium]|jgi:L-lactate dehydrogenase|nr:L-lactate dehydrogenase [Actinomycetota bacterium]
MIGTAAATTKVAVVGAGSVGATLAYACLVRGIGRTIALYDVNADKTRAEVLDLQHGLQFVPQATVVGSDDIEVCRGADLVVITAGAKQKPGQTRLELAEANVNLSRKLIPQLLEVAPDAILLLVTNPVDVITYAALKFSGLPPQRVFGSGTVLDSSRLRLLVAEHCGVAVQNVHAYIAGEHGDSEIPLWSSASIGSVPLLAWEVPGRRPLDAAARTDIHRRVVGAAGEIIRGKGATNYAVGLAAARIIEAVLYDQSQVLPVSSLLEGQGGIDDVCLSLPSVVDRLGVELVLSSPLSEEEAVGLRKSADTVKGVIKTLGL